MTKQIFEILIHIANESYDGHLTIMKFTTNWRVGFGTPNDRAQLKEMTYEGDGLAEAALKAIEHEVCKSKI